MQARLAERGGGRLARPAYPRALVVLSARVGNFQFHPFWTLLTDQLWIRLMAGYHQVLGFWPGWTGSSSRAM